MDLKYLCSELLKKEDVLLAKISFYKNLGMSSAEELFEQPTNVEEDLVNQILMIKEELYERKKNL